MIIRTKVVLRAGFELLVHHELFNLPRHCLDMVDDQLVQIGELMCPIDDELRADSLACRVRVGLHDIYNDDERSSSTSFQRRYPPICW